MNGVNDFTSIIDFVFTYQKNLFVYVISQNIFLMTMFVLCLVVLVIRIKDTITK